MELFCSGFEILGVALAARPWRERQVDRAAHIVCVDKEVPSCLDYAPYEVPERVGCVLRGFEAEFLGLLGMVSW